MIEEGLAKARSHHFFLLKRDEKADNNEKGKCAPVLSFSVLYTAVGNLLEFLK